ncbi:MAG TPA: DNA polymerase III subunit alpha [Bacillota bacterium]|nr:DNA polymerase III subunit alpha [Bacillota bacterium]HQD81192.1 DNA polymerase III subunit alpha [Bacillota bacterium]
MDGACRPDELASRISELGMDSCAITDHGCLYGLVDFYRACNQQGVKPILGCEVYVANRTLHDRTPHIDDNPYHLVLLAENDVGYSNLLKLSSLGYTEGFYYKPRVDKKALAEHSEGLIALSACLSGEVPSYVAQGRIDEAEAVARQYLEIFGRDSFFLEIQSNGMRVQDLVNRQLVQLGRKLGVSVVATNDVHYLRREDATAHDVLLCIQTGSVVDDPSRMRFPTDQFYLKSAEEMYREFAEIPEACAMTARIAERCNVELDFDTLHMPEFEAPPGQTLDSYLRRLCEEGAIRRFGAISREVRERLDYELGIIERMGYSGYFLIVWDFIRYAKSQGIYVGPGRGSAPGSLAAYCLGITDVDPLAYNLLFERFLNPERVTMPDIDVDFCYERRGEVIDYVAGKYGSDKVAQIITFGTMAARAAIRDVGRALKFSYAEVDRIAKLVPAELNMTIDRALEVSPELAAAVGESERNRTLIEIARAVEGLPRHPSVHAAGVVISKDPLTDHVPLYKSADGVLTTQYPMEDLERLGIVKMDFLGLRTLTVIGNTVEIVKHTRNEDVDIESIPLDDPMVYEMLRNAESEGVFQLESSLFQNMLREVKPTKFEDLVAIVALGRPGPMVMTGDFVRGKHCHDTVKYPHPALEKILEPTYGVMLYQEQVMQAASELAGFSLGEADMLRRAMGKKKPEVIAGLRDRFMEGALGRGVSERAAQEVFSLIERFAGYGFNKSHSAAYALISYRTAYLRCHYFPEFMASTLTSVMGSSERVAMYIDVCRAAGVDVLPPNVNESFKGFTVSGNTIRFGLGAIKNVGEGAAESIISARKSGGPFVSFVDFCNRVDMTAVNRKALESLIRCGAFSEFGKRRALLAIMDQVCDQSAVRQRHQESGQASFFDLFEEPSGFGTADIPLPDVPDFSESQILAMEKELLGLYISGHPLASVAEAIRKVATMSVRDLSKAEDGAYSTLAGVIIGRKQIITRTGQPMAFVQIEDLTGQVEVVVFPRTYQECADILARDAIVVVKGRVDVKEEGIKILADSITELPKILANA